MVCLKRRYSGDTCHYLHRFSELAIYIYKEGKVEWEAQTARYQCSTSTFENPVGVLPCTGRSEINDRADRLAAKRPSQVACVSEELMSLRHYLQTQIQRYHTIDFLEESSLERRTARRSFLKGQGRVIVNQRNTGDVSKATLGKLLRDGMECVIMGFSERMDTFLN